MKNMILKTIPIEYDEDTETYGYRCPFCGKECVYPDDYLCEDVVFAFEDINRQTLAFGPDVENQLYSILIDKRSDFLPDFYDRWQDEKPQSRRSQDPDEWDSTRSNLLDDYLRNGFNMDDFMKTLRCSDLKGWLKELVVAETEDDPEGFGQTHIVLKRKMAGGRNANEI